MPTYQYACTTCDQQIEAVQSFTDDPLTQCPACEGRLRKLYTGVGIVFKGSGFYRTDSRTAPAGDGAAAMSPKEKAPASASGESSSGGSSSDASAGVSARSSGESSNSGSGTAKGSSPAGSSKRPAAASTTGAA